MADKFISAELNNQIGQKMFAYIHDGHHLTDALKSKFKKSLIFIGDEGQIYNPLTNTYVGIGTTAYTNLQKYADYINNKVDTLNQALTSSMVSGIYANIDRSDFGQFGTAYSYVDGEVTTLQGLADQIYATNELVLKGLGDYDPTTKAASLKEYFNIIDENLTDNTQALLNSAYLVRQNVSSPFATSGITVSLVKGKNKWRFNLRTAYVDVTQNGTKLEKSFFLEAKDSVKGVSSINYTDISYTSGDFNKVAADLKRFASITNDFDASNETIVNEYLTKFNEYYEPAMDSVNTTKQLYKNGKNSFVIDDKLTWSYIASAYSYTLDFAKKYTTNEVNRIYNEILGVEHGEASLIPVDSSLLKKVISDGEHFQYNEETKTFEPVGADADGMLWKTELNDETKFYKKVYFNKALYSTTADVPTIDSDLDGVTPTYPVTRSLIPTIAKGGWKTEQGNGETVVKLFNNSLAAEESDANSESDYSCSISLIRSWEDIDTVEADKFYQGPENVNFGAESSDAKANENYDLNYLLVPVTELDDVVEGYDYVIINKLGKAASHNINLADGINTLKEAAYVLDWITNGSLDPNNPEASGIEMAYSIAQNHIDIENLHNRLVQVEGGLNVVNNLSTSTATNKYVKLNWESNVSNLFDTNYVETLSKDGNHNQLWSETSKIFENVEFDNTYIYLMRVAENNFEQVLPSLILSYNTLCKAYNDDVNANHKDGVTALTAPSFTEHFGVPAVYPIHKFTVEEIDSDSEDKFAGHVTLGVDLKLATTYTMHQYGHTPGDDGYVYTPFKDINKTLEVTLVLPKTVVSQLTGLSINANRYSDTNATITVDTIRAINSLLSKYDVQFGLTAGTAKFGQQTVDGVSVVIELDDATNFGNFDTALVKEVSHVYKLAATASNSPFDGKLYNEGKQVVDADSEIFENTKYLFRYEATDSTVKFAANDDAIATTEWVTSYSAQAINSLNGKFIDVKLDTMNYVDEVINSLDSTASVPAGHVISNVKIENGKIQVESRELANDKVVIDSVVWNGNGSKVELVYGAISNDATNPLDSVLYKDYVATDTDIFVQFGSKYLPYDENIDALADINKLTDNTAATAIFDKAYIYTGSEYISLNNVDDIDKINALRSLKLGKEYANYIKVYKKVNDYVRIDKADLSIVDSKWSYRINGQATSDFYYQTSAVENQKSTKYLDAEFVKHDIVNGGTGENTLHLTAHITKLQDASLDNTGFADAYDIKNTLSDIFEWVDLSLYDDNSNPQNPVAPTV